MPFFERQKFRMHYEVHEGIVDRDTVAIHGNLASNTWWKPTIEILKRQSGGAKNGRFIAAEWRGCGKSTGLSHEDELNLPHLADDYNELLRELGVRGGALIGHSTGGLIALYAMRRAPELYSRALLLDPVGATGAQFKQEIYDGFVAMSRDRNYCETVMTASISKTVHDKELLKQIVDDAYGVHPLVWHGVAMMLHEADFRSELPYIKQPVLVLHGEIDAILPKSSSEILAKGLPHGKYIELPGRGHSSNLEDPEMFVSHINNFLFG